MLDFLEGNSGAMAEQLAWFQSKPDYAYIGFNLQPDAEGYAGHQHKAREFGRRAFESALFADRKETAAEGRVSDAVREAVVGNAVQARQAAAEALKLAPTSRSAEIGAALAFAMAGDTTRAESLTQDLRKHFPLDTLVHSLLLPTINRPAAPALTIHTTLCVPLKPPMHPLS